MSAPQDDFPSAADVRAQAAKAETLAAQGQIMDIRTKITQALEMGKTSVYVFEKLQPGVQALLEAKGYQLTHSKGFPGDQLGNDHWVVSW